MRVLEKHDPRRMKSGTLRTMTIRADELDLAVNYLANRFGKGSTRIVLRPGVLALSASVEVPANPLGRYVNVQALLRETAGLPAFDELRIGRLPMPGVARRLGARPRDAEPRSDRRSTRSPPTRSAACSIADGSVRIVYEWRDDLPARVGNVLLVAGGSRAAQGLPGAPRAGDARRRRAPAACPSTICSSR